MPISDNHMLVLYSHVTLPNFASEEHHSRPTQNLSAKQAELFHVDISSHLVQIEIFYMPKIVWRNALLVYWTAEPLHRQGKMQAHSSIAPNSPAPTSQLRFSYLCIVSQYLFNENLQSIIFSKWQGTMYLCYSCYDQCRDAGRQNTRSWQQ